MQKRRFSIYYTLIDCPYFQKTSEAFLHERLQAWGMSIDTLCEVHHKNQSKKIVFVDKQSQLNLIKNPSSSSSGPCGGAVGAF
jgi:hypothetical protein